MAATTSSSTSSGSTTTTTTVVHNSSSASSASNSLFAVSAVGIAGYCVMVIMKNAYLIRMQAIEEYGPVIHEFDPYFNYRATEYLYEHGLKKFLTWFDHMVWYPLGRPVGTTIYPGMQVTAVAIKEYMLTNWSLNDICCYIPAWFGALATFIVGMITYECTIPQNTNSTLFQFVLELIFGTNSSNTTTSAATTTTTTTHSANKKATAKIHNAGGSNKTKTIEQHPPNLAFGLHSPALECAVFSMAMMAIVPAHLMRSIGGGYDNESIAVSAMTLTFYFWMRALRNPNTDTTTEDHTISVQAVIYGILTGLAYFYMVATWGGYIFVLNLIGVHAGLLVLMGRFTTNIYISYSLFYVIGTLLAIQVPVVGYAPIRSLEQLGPCLVFVGYQLLQFVEIMKRRKQLSRTQTWKLRIQVFSGTLGLILVLVLFLAPTGYFGPISARVRGLFVHHTRTGNPLVDSVAEHQPASGRAYFQYLHHVCSLAPIGYLMIFFNLSNTSSFLITWGTCAYFFSHKMVRLILLTAPIGSILAGIAAGRLFSWCVKQWWDITSDPAVVPPPEGGDSDIAFLAAGGSSKGSKDGKKPTKKGKKAGIPQQASKKGGATTQQPYSKTSYHSSGTNYSGSGSTFDGLVSLKQAVDGAFQSKEGVLVRRALALLILFLGHVLSSKFIIYCWRLSKEMSNPTIIIQGRLKNGQVIQVDDYREAYWWLRDNTPEDSRIMAWWDYGYQITAIANRTTIADGNTWNHEHIALLGMALTAPIDLGYEIARHLADYVLVWAGGGGDDLGKSPHLARIANSVYRDVCPGDPTCRAFGFIDQQGTPSSMMEKSLLYRLHGHKLKPGIDVDPEMFVEVFRSKYGKVRIYQVVNASEESKQWVTENRQCDAGGWFCPGQYPPALNSIISRKKDFAQLEDFNRKRDDTDTDEYQKQYFENMRDPKKTYEKMIQEERLRKQQQAAAAGDEGDAGAAAATPDSDGYANLSPDEKKKKLDEIYNTWEDTEDTTLVWRLISENQVEELNNWLKMDPSLAFVRSKDGRGPMWWAFEQRNEEITTILMKAGVPHNDRDMNGLTPVDLLKG